MYDLKNDLLDVIMKTPSSKVGDIIILADAFRILLNRKRETKAKLTLSTPVVTTQSTQILYSEGGWYRHILNLMPATRSKKAGTGVGLPKLSVNTLEPNTPIAQVLKL